MVRKSSANAAARGAPGNTHTPPGDTMSNDARISPGAHVPYGRNNACGYEIGTYASRYVPVVWVRPPTATPDYPALAATLSETLTKSFGTGVDVHCRGDDFVLTGLGDPRDWTPEDGVLLRRALWKTYNAMRKTATPRTLATRIRRKNVSRPSSSTSSERGRNRG